MHLIPRSALTATPIAVALTLAMTVGASAQVASLVSPDETPDPETSDVMLEFEDQTEAMLAYAQCLRDNGIEVDDPQAGAGGMRAILGGGPGGGDNGIDRRSEEFQAANEACSMYLEAVRPDLDPEAETVMYCRSGPRSAWATERLMEMGFKRVFNLNGGILAWIREVDPSLMPY